MLLKSVAEVEMSIIQTIYDNVPNAKSNPWKVAEHLFPQLADFANYPDNSGEPCGHVVIERLLDLHMAQHAQMLWHWCEQARKTARKNPPGGIFAGDQDVSLEMVLDTENKTVFVVANSFTVADVTQWLVIWDHCGIERISDAQAYVGELHEKEDYPRKRYPDKLGRKFWKARKFVAEYVDAHYMTKLGSIYGDTRDPGFVARVRRSFDSDRRPVNRTEPVHGGYARYASWVHAMSNLHFIATAFEPLQDELTTKEPEV